MGDYERVNNYQRMAIMAVNRLGREAQAKDQRIKELEDERDKAEAGRGNLRHAAGVFVAATEHELEDAPAPVSEWFDDALGARYGKLRKQVEQGGE